MTEAQPTTQGNTTWWITSLAISVVCCAILFVVFAGYLFGFREKLLIVETKLSMIEQRNAQLGMEIDNLHRRTPIQQIQVIPPNVAPPQYIQQSAQPPITTPEASGGEGGTPIVGVPALPSAKRPTASEQGLTPGIGGTAAPSSPSPSAMPPSAAPQAGQNSQAQPTPMQAPATK